MVSSKVGFAPIFYIFLALALMSFGIHLAYVGHTSGLALTVLFGLFLLWILRSIAGLTIYPDRLCIYRKFSRRTLARSDIRAIRLWDEKGRITDQISIDIISNGSIDLAGGYFDFGGGWRNEGELKRTLVEQYADLMVRPAEDETHRPHARPYTAAEPETFSGNALLCMNGIIVFAFSVIWILGTIIIYSPGSLAPWWGVLLISVPIAMIIVAMTDQLYYFDINADSLEIRNHVMRWYKREYSFADINTAILVPMIARRSRALWLKTVDFDEHRYGAGSLRTKDWKALANALKKRHIPTQNRD
jgi:hypothetical protein